MGSGNDGFAVEQKQPTERPVYKFSILYFPRSVYKFSDVKLRYEAAVCCRLPNNIQRL